MEHKINILPAHMADLIAAGEVVERPASAVKELMENAIDAGATAITIEIQNGGLTYIRVTDNGCGMNREDAQLAFLRHATSKIRDERDLEAIGTLGFRGEALAAIAAVSRIELLTCVNGEEGISLSLEAGKILSSTPAGCPAGTTIIVRDLFFNTPARLKFMKKDSYEASAVHQAVIRIALSHPEISIKYIHDGKQELMTPGDNVLLNCIYNTLGRDLALGLLEVSWENNNILVTGFISRPTSCRGNRTSQYFFVNGRHIKSQGMTGALEAAYKNRIMVGRFPMCIINVNLKLSSVDVNVHPTKTEVKFFAERDVFNAVYHAVSDSLDHENGLSNGMDAKPADNSLPQSKPVQTVFKPYPNLFHSNDKLVFHNLPPLYNSSVPKEDSYKVQDNNKQIYSDISSESLKNNILSPLSSTSIHNDSLQSINNDDFSYRVVGEALNTYIIVEQTERLILIDKHAAHERIIYDRLKKGKQEVMMQTLLTPEIYTPSPLEKQVLLENSNTLIDLGFELEDFGGGSVIIRQAPADVDICEIIPLLGEIANELMSNQKSDGGRDKLLALIACKAAIKAGKASALAELNELTYKVLKGEIKYCPHGRPVSVELTRYRLDKLFGRA